MKLHEYELADGRVVEFSRDTQERVLRVTVGGEAREPIDIDCSAPLLDFYAWDSAGRSQAKAIEYGEGIEAK